jgi:uncharacterized membrane protein
MLGLFLLYIIVPKIDPLKNNIKSFIGYYNAFWAAVFAFMLYIFALTLVCNIGWQFNFTMAIIPAMAILWFLIGAFLEKLKRNWFIGIRTPWTLSNDIVWDKTHKLGGKLFKAAGVIALAGLFIKGPTSFLFIIAPVIAFAIITVVYSYIAYKKLK